MPRKDRTIRPNVSEIGAPTIRPTQTGMRGDTLSAAIDRYLTAYAAKRMRPDYFNVTKWALERDVKTVLGARPIREITRRDVRELIDGIVERGAPAQAHNTLAYLRLMLNWAVSNDLIEASPVKGLKIRATPGRKAAYTWNNQLRRKRLADKALEEATLLLAPGTRCVAYYQVYSSEGSPPRPGRDYDLAAQQRVVKRLVDNAGADFMPGAAFEQLERPGSYNQTERLQLGAALRYCKAQGSTLVIAHLGRMASSAPFLSQLAASDVPFVACDRSDVTPLTIQEFAIAARRRKAAKIKNMRALRASGVLPHRPVETPEGRRRARETATRKARDFAEKIHPYLQAAQRKSGTHRQLAAMLNSVKGLKTRQGLKWNRQTVTRALRCARTLPPPTELQIAAAANLMEAAAAKQHDGPSRAASAPSVTDLRGDAISAPTAPSTTAQPPKKKRGPKPVLTQAILARMQAEMREGIVPREQLADFDEEALAARHNASRYTVRKARKAALSL